MVQIRQTRHKKCSKFQWPCTCLLAVVVCYLLCLEFLAMRVTYSEDSNSMSSLLLPELMGGQSDDDNYSSMHVLLPKLMGQLKKGSLKKSTGRLIDLGAGVRDDDPMFPFVDRGWEALLVDGDPAQELKLKDRFPNDNAHKVISYITADTIPHLLEDHGFGQKDDANKVDMLKVDIDSFDCFVMHKILKIINPTVLVMEINVKYPAHVRFAMFPGFEKTVDDAATTTANTSNQLSQMEFNSETRGRVYGCSLAYQVHDLMRPNGYELLHVDWNNAIYILKDSLKNVNLSTLNVVLDHKQQQQQHTDIKDNDGYTLASPEQMYDEGYWNRPQREWVFRNNKDTVQWHELSSSDIFRQLQYLFREEHDTSHKNHHVYMADVDPKGQNELRHGCFDALGQLGWYSNQDGDKAHVCSISKGIDSSVTSQN